ncbi:hypothetical protein APY04_0159 [Hyphomicrobium sulfonivorans]|uniref:Uncharacterized protein n=1 Tax=Hyphomicrobium sulfonivorans TaxID=121290 RepID=A0A109BPM5_HYPSL|nr:CHAP domain-containing protein [Hyphomicrobium sulfonivorans]KWT72365.1 hypothetical protein APY04_0159 [Hyphomicrobium sulfonivorans]
MTQTAASIRNKNPGAQYPGESAAKFGGNRYETLRSGDGEHKIATFATFEDGGAALFDLLLTHYAWLPLEAALTKWSGGYRSGAYTRFVSERTTIKADTVLSVMLLRDPRQAIPLAKAMAHWEAGQEYPMTDKQWAKAHTLAVAADTPADTPADEVPPYLEYAISKLGLKEIPGKEDHNDDIVAMFRTVGRDEVKNDETAWCAAFVGACLVFTGYKLPPVPRTELLMARCYLKLPQQVSTKNVRPGDIRIEARGPAPFGHVEIVVEVDHARKTIKTIGGNVSNSVAYRTKSLTGGGLLGYRRPSRDPASVKFVVKSTPMTVLVGLFASASAYLYGAMDWVANGVLGLLGILPNAVDAAAPHISMTQQVYSWLGFPPSTWLIGGILGSSFAMLAYHTWKSERAK